MMFGMPDKIWATTCEEMGEYTTNRWENKKITYTDSTAYLRATPARKHAKEMYNALNLMVKLDGMDYDQWCKIKCIIIAIEGEVDNG